MRALGIAVAAMWLAGCSLLFDPTSSGTAIDAGAQDSIDDFADADRPDQVHVWSGSTAHHTCASKGSRVICWGDNTFGQLGIGSRGVGSAEDTVGSRAPLTLADQVVEMSLAYGHTCALLANGKVHCWGSNSEGELGLNSAVDLAAPLVDVAVQISMEEEGAEHLSVGEDYSCVAMASGKMRCWGNVSRLLESYAPVLSDPENFWGDDEHPSAKPDIPTSFPIRALGVGATHGCAVAQSGNQLECWGAIEAGANEPSEVLIYDRAGRVVSGALFSCLLDADGKINCWGNDDSLQLGTATDPYDQPEAGKELEFNGGVTARQVAPGLFHVCARFVNGSVHCWGRGSNGATGHGKPDDLGDTNLAILPTEVPFEKNAVSIAAGGYHTCVSFDDDAIRCFGNNQQGQLASGTSCVDLGGAGNACNYGDESTELAIDIDDLKFFD